jgi:hypothetical protein
MIGVKRMPTRSAMRRDLLFSTLESGGQMSVYVCLAVTFSALRTFSAPSSRAS